MLMLGCCPTSKPVFANNKIRYLLLHMRRLPKNGCLGGAFCLDLGACEVAQRAVKSSAIDGARCLDELGKKSCPKIRSEREVRAILVLGDGEGNVP